MDTVDVARNARAERRGAINGRKKRSIVLQQEGTTMKDTSESGGDVSYRPKITSARSGHNGTAVQPWNFGGPTYVCLSCHATVWYEERNRKSRRPVNPKFSICCKGGKIKLPWYKKCPDYLHNLLDYNGRRDSSNFRENIWVYNGMFAITSVGGRIDNLVSIDRGPYVFRISRQNYHKIGSMLTTDGQAKFAQLYIYDTSNEVTNRVNAPGLSARQSTNPHIIKNLISMFNDCNELAKVFRMARDRYESSSLTNVSLHLLERRDRDGRQYNIPTTSEIAALVTGNGSRSEGYM